MEHRVYTDRGKEREEGRRREKSSATWVDLAVRTSLRGSGRGEGGVLLYRIRVLLYTRYQIGYMHMDSTSSCHRLAIILLLCVDVRSRHDPFALRFG